MRQVLISLRLITLATLLLIPGSCSAPPKRLDPAELRTCLAQGGYESGGPFGNPFCQFRYADGGRSCSGKMDCQGRCILWVDGEPNDPLPQPGDTAVGVCEAEQSTFGCYAVVEQGRISPSGAICWE